MIKTVQHPAPLLKLPDEILSQALAYLDPGSVLQLSAVCRRLNRVSQDDRLWHSFIQSHLHTRLTTCKPKQSYRELYTAHEPYWFIPQRKIWFADSWPHGKVLVARYDERRACIEAYTIVAEPGQQRRETLSWLDGTIVSCLTFRPEVALDLNKPVVSLTIETPIEINSKNKNVPRHQKEIVMDDIGGPASREAPSSSFMLTHVLPNELIDSRTKFWPPLTLPSIAGQRTRNDSASSFTQPGTKPRSAAEASDATFRVRQWVQFGRFYGLGAGQMIRTFATLPAECYTPTKEKPWQGIWVGDYSGHGCEFLLVTQPDEPQRLPRKARRAYELWPRSTVAFENNQMVSTLSDSEEDSDDYDSDTIPDSSRPPSSNGIDTDRAVDLLDDTPSSSASPKPESAQDVPDDPLPYRGRLEAIKLTGDQNVPRGEYTFIAPDIGQAGLVGHLDHPMFSDSSSRLGIGGSEGPSPGNGNGRGARVVKSIGHVGQSGFTRDFYIPSQLVMISENRLAQYWVEHGILVFFERVDVDGFVNGDGMVRF